MAKATTTKPKTTKPKTTATATKKSGSKGTKKAVPDATAPIYNPIGSMSTAARTAFPKADFVLTFEVPADNTAGLVISAFAGPNLQPRMTDLQSRSEIPAGNANAVQLLPKEGELLQTFLPDRSVALCVSRPRWIWVGTPVTQL